MSLCRSEVVSRQSLRLTVSAVLLKQLYRIWSGLAADSFSIAKWLSVDMMCHSTRGWLCVKLNYYCIVLIVIMIIILEAVVDMFIDKVIQTTQFSEMEWTLFSQKFMRCCDPWKHYWMFVVLYVSLFVHGLVTNSYTF
jgi:hypothetical protein